MIIYGVYMQIDIVIFLIVSEVHMFIRIDGRTDEYFLPYI